MSSNYNRFGLSRYIPADVKREVRERCSFGCVICGRVPYHYDHFKVPFAEAKEHDPEDIVLLCVEHHQHKTNGIVTNDLIETAIRMDVGKDSGVRFKLPASSPAFEVVWPHVTLNASRHQIIVDEEPIFEIKPQDNPLEPIALSGEFSDLQGRQIFTIVDNEITVQAENIGDFEITADRFLFKTPKGRTSIHFQLNGKELRIADIFFTKRDAFVVSGQQGLHVGNLFTGVVFMRYVAQSVGTAIKIGSTTDTPIDFENVDMKRFPASIMTDCAADGCTVGIQIDGRPKVPITSNYDRLT